jgi:cold-inducible RNA-binding protein
MAQKLYVGNLSYSTSEAKLRTLFGEFGEIVSVNVITDRETGRPKGFAFVEMATDQAAQAAIGALNGKSVDGREIKVDKAQPPRDRGAGGRGGPGGGRGGSGGRGPSDRRSGDRRSYDRDRSDW